MPVRTEYNAEGRRAVQKQVAVHCMDGAEQNDGRQVDGIGLPGLVSAFPCFGSNVHKHPENVQRVTGGGTELSRLNHFGHLHASKLKLPGAGSLVGARKCVDSFL